MYIIVENLPLSISEPNIQQYKIRKLERIKLLDISKKLQLRQSSLQVADLVGASHSAINNYRERLEITEAKPKARAPQKLLPRDKL